MLFALKIDSSADVAGLAPFDGIRFVSALSTKKRIDLIGPVWVRVSPVGQSVLARRGKNM